MQLNQIMVGIVLASVLTLGMVQFISLGNEVYPQTNYNESELQVFNKMSELNIIINKTRNDVTELESNPNVLDIIGSFFTNAYRSIVGIGKSVDILTSMVGSGVDYLPIGGYGEVLKNGLTLIVTIIIIVGIFLAIITKSPRN